MSCLMFLDSKQNLFSREMILMLRGLTGNFVITGEHLKSNTQENTPNWVGLGNKNDDSGERAREKNLPETSFTNFMKACMVTWQNYKKKKMFV